MNKMYQGKYKREFLETVNDQASYMWLFDKTFDFEQRFGKDLFDFSKEEILEFLGRKKLAFSTIRVHRSYIAVYIQWALNKGLKKISKIPTLEITDEDLKKISKKTKLIHADQIYSMVGIPGYSDVPVLKNFQDRLLVYLLFLGIRGDRASELINLKIEHIDFENNLIKLRELNSERADILIDDFGLNLVKNSIAEITYDRYLDETNPSTTNTKEFYNLNESDYLFRQSSVGLSKKDGGISYDALLKRLKTISSYTGLQLTMNSIEKAGMIHIGKKLIDSGVKLKASDETVKKALFERYNIKGYNTQSNTLSKLRKYIAEIDTENQS